MRYFIAVLAIAASPSFAATDKITDKASCMSHLNRAITMADAHKEGDGPSLLRRQKSVFSEVQNRDLADAIIDAYSQIADQYQTISETLFELCATYD